MSARYSRVFAKIGWARESFSQRRKKGDGGDRILIRINACIRINGNAGPRFPEETRMIAEFYPAMVIAAIGLFSLALLGVSISDQLSRR